VDRRVTSSARSVSPTVDKHSSRNPYRGVKRFMIFSSGARPEILVNCATDESTYVGLGGTVVATAVLAGASMAFALQRAFHASVAVSVALAFVWAAIVFNLDRWLITSQKRMGSVKKQILAAVPRILVSVLFGLVISEPLVLQIFRSELDAQTTRDRAVVLDAAAKLRTGGAKALEVASNEKKIAALSDTGAADSPDVKNLRARIDRANTETATARTTYDAAEIELTKEVEGLSITKKPKCGPVCRVKTQTRDQALKRYNETKAKNDADVIKLEGQITKLEGDSEKTRAAAAAENEKRRKKLETANDKLKKQIDNDYNAVVAQSDTGLLADMRSLDHLSSDNSAVLFAHLALMLLLIAIDTLPVLGKLLQSLAPARSYEVLCDAVDLALKEQAGELVDEAVDGRKSRRTLFLADAAVRERVERENIEHFVTLAASTQREIGEHMLAEWRASELRRIVDPATMSEDSSEPTVPESERATVPHGERPTPAERRRDRRSAPERRLTIGGVGPGDIERRAGVERRTGAR
jgi:Domain of unknown function (DUF4407)